MESNQIEQNLYQMLTVTEEQQKNTASALKGLAQEREALAKERAALQENIQTAVQQAVSTTLKEGLREALKGSPEAISKASSTLTDAASWFSFKLFGFCAGALALVAFLIFGFVEWEKYEYQSMVEKKKLLEEELPQLEARTAEWEERAGRATLNRCGPKKKLCVKVNKQAGVFGTEGEFYVIDGY
jgi:hypothetical protein